MRWFAELPPTFCRPAQARSPHGWCHGHCADLWPGGGTPAREHHRLGDRACPPAVRHGTCSDVDRAVSRRRGTARAEAAQARGEAAQARNDVAEARSEAATTQAKAAEVSAEVASAIAQRDAALERAREIAPDRESMINQFKVLSTETLDSHGQTADCPGGGPTQGDRTTDDPGPRKPRQVQRPAHRGGERAGSHVRATHSGQPCPADRGDPTPRDRCFGDRIAQTSDPRLLGRDTAQAESPS